MRKSEVLAHELVACLNRALAHLRDIWEEIGIPEDQRVECTEVMRKNIQGLLDKMVAEEESLKERLLRSIATSRKELATLCGELQLPHFEEDEELTVLQLEKDLRTRVGVLLKQELKTEQEQDLHDLCTAPYGVGDSSVPSLEDLDQFWLHLAALGTEKERRQMEFVSTKRQVVRCMGELEQDPDTSFERAVVCEDEDAFCLSEENLAALKDLPQQLAVLSVHLEHNKENLTQLSGTPLSGGCTPQSLPSAPEA